MRSICLYFQVHQPFRLKTYRFFEIGVDHQYYDEYQNRTIVRRVADKSYLPMNKLLLGLIKEYGASFKVSFSISGIALDQFELYAPDVIDSFKALAKTGNVEFLGETYAHSLVSLKDAGEFKNQVKMHSDRIESLFGKRPTSFRNTELIYSDQIGEQVLDMGFNVMLTEGAKHILGWKSPNFMYCNAANPRLKLLLRNYQLSDDIRFRFSNQNWIEWPLTAEKFANWISSYDKNQQVVNIFLDYETFGEHQWAETGIFDFMKALPRQVMALSNYKFDTPSGIAAKIQPISAVSVPVPISWADEERDLTAWLGNDLQNEAIESLYALLPRFKGCASPELKKDWINLQSSDHFYYMCTKWFSDGDVHNYFNPYSTPYEAFINYMNVLSDFIARLASSKPENVVSEETFSVPDPRAAKKNLKIIEDVDGSDENSVDYEVLLSLSKAKINRLIESVDAKTMAYAMYDRTEEEVQKLLKKLPATLREEFTIIRSKLKKPAKTTIESYKNKMADMLKSLF
jgi:alpha-amylase